MRKVGKKINIMKYVEVEELVVKEEIKSVTQYPIEKVIRVEINSFNEQNNVVRGQMVDIDDIDYDLILSDNALFGDGKSSGCFRETDLWKMIDKVKDK